MLAPREFDRFVRACTSIGNETADEDGFVPVRNLLNRFHARLLIRPLLVEGMLASVEQDGGNFTVNKNRWTVLLDSESYDVSDSEVDTENRDQPLPARFRNTVAHELVHSLAFRPSEFGVRLSEQRDAKKGASDLVRDIERETERLSPLLLWSDKGLERLLAGRTQSLSAADLAHVCLRMGISRHVLVNRLCLLRATDSNRFLDHPGLRNLAIGMAEWHDGKRALVRSWPMFVNFDRNIIPGFLFKVAQQDHAPAATIFPDATFAMCGGADDIVEMQAGAGVPAAPNAERMNVQLSFEHASTRDGAEFLFVVKKSLR